MNGNQLGEITHWPYPFMIQQQTPKEKDAAPLTPAP